jgi:hypothetical protein
MPEVGFASEARGRWFIPPEAHALATVTAVAVGHVEN